MIHKKSLIFAKNIFFCYTPNSKMVLKHFVHVMWVNILKFLKNCVETLRSPKKKINKKKSISCWSLVSICFKKAFYSPRYIPIDLRKHIKIDIRDIYLKNHSSGKLQFSSNTFWKILRTFFQKGHILLELLDHYKNFQIVIYRMISDR